MTLKRFIPALGLFIALACGSNAAPPAANSPAGAPPAANSPAGAPAAANTPAPTATPEPVRLSGAGDAVVDLAWENMAAIAAIAGNAEGRLFAVWSIDQNNEKIDLLVNTTDPYDGVRLINMDKAVARFEINAAGPWTITVNHLGRARRLDVPGAITGLGDDVILLIHGSAAPDTAAVSGNEDARLFALWGYTPQGRDLLVNTTDPYRGAVLLNPKTVILEVIAGGYWSIEVTGK